MQRGERFRFVLILALALALISASIGLAGDAIDDPDEASTCRPTEVVDDCDDHATDTDASDAADASDPAVEEIDAERAAACEEAATPDGESEGAESQESTKLTGLENAIARVLENCLKNENAPGLITALEHLAENMSARPTSTSGWRRRRPSARPARPSARPPRPSARRLGQPRRQRGKPRAPRADGRSTGATDQIVRLCVSRSRGFALFSDPAHGSSTLLR